MEKMANNKTKKEPESIAEQLSYDWNILGLANVAQDYSRQGKEGLTKKSLELLLGDIGVDPATARTITDPKVMNLATKNYLDVYNQGRAHQKVGDLLNYHGSTLEKYLGENTARARAELSEYNEQKYGKILLEIEKAKHTIEGYKLGKNSKEEAKSAEETIKKYEKLRTTIVLLEQQNMASFRARVEDSYTRDVLNELYSDKPKETPAEKE